jgi:hypothetical protein
VSAENRKVEGLLAEKPNIVDYHLQSGSKSPLSAKVRQREERVPRETVRPIKSERALTAIKIK